MAVDARDDRRRTALVLGGGGARGAYEAGVLSWILGPLRRRLGDSVRFDILTGTSVGAVNACYLAATADRADAAERLVEIWQSLSLDHVFRLDSRELVRRALAAVGLRRAGARVRGNPPRLPGLLDTRPLEELVVTSIPWKRIRAHIRSGLVSALAVTTTEIATGRSVVFIQSDRPLRQPWRGDPWMVPRCARLMPEHALASAAIPLLFPAVRLGRGYYCDGGLRLNTPLKPALRLGATHVLIVGLRRSPAAPAADEEAHLREEAYSSPTYLAGKALDALLLDRIDADVERLHLFNEVLAAGRDACGPQFLSRVNAAIERRRGSPYRIVREVLVRPSADLGRLASECFGHRKGAPGLRGWVRRRVAGYAASGDADLLSYLFFDGCYARHLIELGRSDAARREEELARFFLDSGD